MIERVILNLLKNMDRQLTQTIASEVQIFQDIEQKQDFLFLLGALLARVISLQKAAEILGIETKVLLKLLDVLGIEFSYLSENDVVDETTW
jgi:hypothetical protein